MAQSQIIPIAPRGPDLVESLAEACSTRHDSLVLDLARRIETIGKQIAKTVELHHSDQSVALEGLRRQLDLEMHRLEFSIDEAWEMGQ